MDLQETSLNAWSGFLFHRSVNVKYQQIKIIDK